MDAQPPRRPDGSLRRRSQYFDPNSVNPLAKPGTSRTSRSSSRDGIPPLPADPPPLPTSVPASIGPRDKPRERTTSLNMSNAVPLGPTTPRPRGDNNAAATQTRRERSKSRVGAALLSKRSSVAYGQPANQVGHVPPPPVPLLPTIADGVPEGEEAATKRAAKSRPTQKMGQHGIDLHALSELGFDPEKFMSASVGTTDPAALKVFRDHLLTVRASTSSELQEGVYKNYGAFIAISKEIATIENEMLELKGVLEEFKTIPASLDIGLGPEDHGLSVGAGSLTSGIRRRTARNSIADVNALYRVQLEALWASVEGSQKFLPATPGRHLQAETTSFVSLHPATYRPRQAVHLFLLNDALLVATKKRTGMGSTKVKLVAEKCFALSEIAVIDLKDGGDLTNAIKIKRGRETSIFRSEKIEEKKALLAAFKKVAEEMANKKRKQSIWEAEHRQTSGRRGAADITNLPGAPGARSDFKPAKFLGLGKDDPSGKDISWIGDFSDELCVSIVTRAYEDAVVLVEKGRTVLSKLSPSEGSSGGPSVSALFQNRLENRTAELMDSLLRDLADPAIRKTGVVRTAGWLLRLGPGAADSARETFLDMRGKLVRKRCRAIKFEGDISLWVGEVAMVVFTLVKNTCEWYVTAFRDNRMASGFVRWASRQIEVYAEMFRRQVFGVDQNPVVVQESLAVTKAHAAMLKDVGLDFNFLLNSLLRPDGDLKRRRSMEAAGQTSRGRIEADARSASLARQRSLQG